MVSQNCSFLDLVGSLAAISASCICYAELEASGVNIPPFDDPDL